MNIEAMRRSIPYDVVRGGIVIATLLIWERAPGEIEEVDSVTGEPWLDLLTAGEREQVDDRLHHARLMREDDLARGQAVLVDEVRDAVEARPTVAWAGEMAA